MTFINNIEPFYQILIGMISLFLILGIVWIITKDTDERIEDHYESRRTIK